MEVLQQTGGHDRHGHPMHRVVLDDGTVVRGCPICLDAEADHQADLAAGRARYAERRRQRAAAKAEG